MKTTEKAHIEGVVIVPFQNIIEGEHEFSFRLKDVFQEHLELFDVKGTDILLKVTLLKKPSLSTLFLEFSGKICSFCDLCVEELDITISKKTQYYVSLKGAFNNRSSEAENIIHSLDSQSNIDISQQAYEEIVLSIPIKRKHDFDCANF